MYEHSKQHRLMDAETEMLRQKAAKKEKEAIVRVNETQSLENKVRAVNQRSAKLDEKLRGLFRTGATAFPLKSSLR